MSSSRDGRKKTCWRNSAKSIDVTWPPRQDSFRVLGSEEDRRRDICASSGSCSVMKKLPALLIVIAVGAVVLWIIRPRTAAVPAILEGNGRIEGDQAAVGAKIGGRIVRLPIRESQNLK